MNIIVMIGFIEFLLMQKQTTAKIPTNEWEKWMYNEACVWTIRENQIKNSNVHSENLLMHL